MKTIKLFYKLKNFFKRNKEFFTELRNKEEKTMNKMKNPKENELISESSNNSDPERIQDVIKNMTNYIVIKKDGTEEEFNIDKILEAIKGAGASEIGAEVVVNKLIERLFKIKSSKIKAIK